MQHPTTLLRRSALAGVATLSLGATLSGILIGGASPTSATPDVALHVAGNQLVNSSGTPVRLLGVDRSGTEYACAQGWGMFDGPSDPASVAAIASWHTDAVRVPLNEDCWLGINGVPAAYSGANYRNAIASYVSELNAAGLVAILDLHWGAPGSQLATGQEQMPDADHAPAFWASVAGTFAHTPGVVFDLFNEPHDVSWSCWLNGCTLTNGTAVAGMQQLLDSVRAAGATQPVMVEGLNWGGDLSGWLAHEPSDPAHDLVASVHLYNFSQCNTVSCWDSTIAPVAAAVPVVTGELGETDCGTGFIDNYMPWADAHGVSYLAWAWDAGGGWSCSSGPGLLQSYDGTPNTFGAGFRSHLADLAAHPAVQSATAAAAPPAGTSTVVAASLTQSWGSGGVVDLHVTNTGSSPLGSAARPWKLALSLPPGASITSMWNATLGSATTGRVTATAPSYTLSLAPGASMDIGWVEQGSTALPSAVSLTADAGTGGAVLDSTYQLITSWGNGGNADITVANVGGQPSGAWTLQAALPSATSLTAVWDGQLVSPASGPVQVAGPSWARSLAPGQSDVVGWTQQGSTAAPSSFSAS